MNLEIPAFKFVDGIKDGASFDTYEQLYIYCQGYGREELIGAIIGDPRIALLFGELPMKLDVNTKELYTLEWRKR